MIGSRIAHYEIAAKIGEGGMGEVYRARDTKLDRDVALKILPREFAKNDDRARRFEQEAKAVAALSHPNILAIYEFGVDQEQPFAAMELLEGEALAERLLDGPLPSRKAVEIGVQVANGLAAAHARGIIHRDLKPGNIFITKDGIPKILDFGLARIDGADDDLSQSPTVQTDPGAVMGTVGYMSPEQARGASVDSRSDVFSLGAVVYEMIAGKRPFDGDSSADIIGAILRDDPKRLHDHDPAVPDALDRIVQHSLEKLPDERFQSARDFGFALANSSSVSQPDLTAPAESSVAKKRNTGVWIGAAVLGWIAVLLLVALPLLESKQEDAPSKLVNLTYSGRDWGPDASPRGDVIAFVSDRDGPQRIWIKQVDGGGEAPLTEGNDDQPRFSPDGTQILFLRQTGNTRGAFRTSTVGSSLRKIIDNVQDADWGPDGNEIAFLRVIPTDTGDNRFVLGIADVQTGAERVIEEVLNRSCFGLRWSPDGRYVLYSESGLTGAVATESNLVLIDMETEEAERLKITEWLGAYTAPEWTPSGRTFIVGQMQEPLATMAGTPGLVMEYDVEKRETRPLFWAAVRVPTGGWGYSTLSILDEGRIVVGQERVHAELHRVELGNDQPADLAHIMTIGLGRDRQPAYSPDGKQVIFSSNRSGNVDLWTVDVASGEIAQVTDDPDCDWDPAFTPDGESILWSSDRSGNMEIWMSDIGGGRAHQVTSDGIDAENATMTRDGKWIVYASANHDKIGLWRIRPDGTDAKLLEPGAIILPEVSPDGRYALYCMLSNFTTIIRVIEIETGETTPYRIDVESSTSRLDNVVPGRARWAPDGQSIYFVALDAYGHAGVQQQDFHPTENTDHTRRVVVDFSQFGVESLGVSPDGKQLTVSALFERRIVSLANDIKLDGWK